MKPLPWLLCTLACATPLISAADDARSTKWVNLRAGPARDYPLVARLAPGTPFAVQGCTQGFGWCDVIAPDNSRGWVYAANISYPYQSAEVPVLGYGAVIGFPIVTFVIGNYWGQYYRDRPWYANEPRWRDRPPPRRPDSRPFPGSPPGGRPDMRPPDHPRDPIAGPPLGNRLRPDQRPPPSAQHPPSGTRPPAETRPPEGQPPMGRPPMGRPPEGRPQGGERPASPAMTPRGTPSRGPGDSPEGARPPPGPRQPEGGDRGDRRSRPQPN